MSFFTRFFFICVLCCSTSMYGQLSDLARVDYTYIPNAKSDVEFTRMRALFNYPIKLQKEGTYLFLGMDYSNIHLKSDVDFSFNTRDLNDFQLLDFSIGYTIPLKNDWRLGLRFRPGFSTNLAANALSLEDVIISGDLIFIKQGEMHYGKRQKWILGVYYSGNSGFNFPLPYITYYKKFAPNWSMSLGVPKTNVQYFISDKHRLKAYAQLDGFTSNLQRDVPVIAGEAAKSINMSLLLSGLQYEYHFTEQLQFYARAAYIFSIDNELRNEQRETIFSFESKAKIYLRTGVKFKI
ncbi:DUF6268 family outer membrane beta-barrel protein [uncultured Kordia sp.]|uniref:DUF6268 family outer membrane beta-barrel protein n=1 Tax=uncultured Kordia sp. TaxID=507699 RepID=UPI002618F1FA|nr:DUF6268 family outer membrane beta-barrel protein [uncultured Kordia sp.]